ncbi:Mediator of DNA damage checkpoint protein 1 [Sorochytrium milnesiophthora]
MEQQPRRELHRVADAASVEPVDIYALSVGNNLLGIDPKVVEEDADAEFDNHFIPLTGAGIADTHAWIRVLPLGDAFIADCGSSDGIVLYSKSTMQPQTIPGGYFFQLVDGSRIRLGQSHFVFRDTFSQPPVVDLIEDSQPAHILDSSAPDRAQSPEMFGEQDLHPSVGHQLDLNGQSETVFSGPLASPELFSSFSLPVRSHSKDMADLPPAALPDVPAGDSDLSDDETVPGNSPSDSANAIPPGQQSRPSDGSTRRSSRDELELDTSFQFQIDKDLLNLNPPSTRKPQTMPPSPQQEEEPAPPTPTRSKPAAESQTTSSDSSPESASGSLPPLQFQPPGGTPAPAVTVAQPESLEILQPAPLSPTQLPSIPKLHLALADESTVTEASQPTIEAPSVADEETLPQQHSPADDELSDLEVEEQSPVEEMAPAAQSEPADVPDEPAARSPPNASPAPRPKATKQRKQGGKAADTTSADLMSDTTTDTVFDFPAAPEEDNASKVEATPRKSRGRKRKSATESVGKEDTSVAAEEVANAVMSPTRAASKRRRSTSPVKAPADPTKPRVMFTMLHGAELKQYSKVLTSLGGSVVDAWAECTHLVVDKVRRSAKFLCALSAGRSIVSMDWIEKSAKRKCFQDPAEFILHDKRAEKQWGFRLGESIAKAQREKLFAGYTFYMTPQCKPPADEMREIVGATGARLTTKEPKEEPEDDGKLVCIGTEDDIVEVLRLERLGHVVQSTEFVLTGVLRQAVDWESFRMTKEVVVPPSKKGASARRR